MQNRQDGKDLEVAIYDTCEALSDLLAQMPDKLERPSAKVHTYYLCRCVQRAFEPKPLHRHPMPEPLGSRDIRLADFGSRKGYDNAPH